MNDSKRNNRYSEDDSRDTRNSNTSNAKRSSKSKNYRNRGSKSSNYRGKGSDRSDSDSRYPRDGDKYHAVDTKTESRGNHIEWYVPDKNQLDNVASILFSHRTGSRMELGYHYDGTVGSNRLTSSPYRIPGAIAARFTPTFGNLENSQSAGNVANTAIYSWVRHANSGSRNYDAVDLGLYLFAMDSIYTGLMHLTRIVATVMTFNRWNEYLPSDLLTIQGCKPLNSAGNSIATELPRMRAWLNNMILKTTTLAAPRTLPIYDRHAYMCTNVFVDEPNEFGQFYLYVPENLWKFGYSGSGSTSKGCLNAVKFVDKKVISDWTVLFSTVQSLIDAVYGDEDCGIMTGDLLKAYGPEGIVKLATVPDDVALMPVYDHDALIQFHNAIPYGELVPMLDQSTPRIDQIIPANAGPSPYLQNSWSVRNPLPGYQHPGEFMFPLDLHNDVNPENIMRATRCQALIVATKVAPDLKPFIIDYSRSELSCEFINSFTIHNREPEDSTLGYYEWDKYFQYADSAVGSWLYAHAASFTLAPLMFYTVKQGPTIYDLVPFGNIDKMTVLSEANLRQLHQVAMLGVFNVPRISLGQITK